MFVPWFGINTFRVFYMGTDPNSPKPGMQDLELRKDGIKLGNFKKRFIPGSAIQKAEVAYNVRQGGLSAGGALVGGLIAGEVGALAGAAAGRRAVEASAVITYRDDGRQTRQVVLSSKSAERIVKKVQKRYLHS